MTVTIRKATMDDREACLQLLDSLFDAIGGERDERSGQVFDQLLDASRGQVLVADEGGALLGLAAVSFNLAMRYGGEYCQLEELIVSPAVRGKNAGGLLLQGTIDNAKARGCAEFGLYLIETTEKNLPFYKKFGFEKVGSELCQKLS